MERSYVNEESPKAMKHFLTLRFLATIFMVAAGVLLFGTLIIAFAAMGRMAELIFGVSSTFTTSTAFFIILFMGWLPAGMLFLVNESIYLFLDIETNTRRIAGLLELLLERSKRTDSSEQEKKY